MTGAASANRSKMGHWPEQSPHQAPARTMTLVCRVNEPRSCFWASVSLTASKVAFQRSRWAGEPNFLRKSVIDRAEEKGGKRVMECAGKGAHESSLASGPAGRPPNEIPPWKTV